MTAPADDIRALPDAIVSDGYVLRAYRAGDENDWVALLQYGDFSMWDRARMDNFLADPRRKAGSRVVEHDNRIVAATFASWRESSPSTGVLDFVISHPEHRGNGLGRAVCTAVSKFLVKNGSEAVNLHTDDWRLEAINLYLSLGFVPDMTRDDMAARWDAIMTKLNDMKKWARRGQA